MLTAFAVLALAANLPDYDAVSELPRTRTLPDDLSARRVLTTGFVSRVDDRTGAPVVFFAERPARRTSFPPRSMGLGAEEVARRALFTHAALYRAQPVEFASLELKEVHDLGAGAVVVTFRRRVGELPLLRDEVHVVMTHDLELVALTGSVPMHAPQGSFRLTESTALATALADLTGAWPEQLRAHAEGQPRGGWRSLHVTGTEAFSQPPQLRRGYFALGDDVLPVFQLVLQTGAGGWTHVISAHDGQLLLRNRLDHDAAFDFRAWVDAAAPFTPFEGPSGGAGLPHPTGAPNGFVPSSVPAALVNIDSSGLGQTRSWLPDDAVRLEGNNAWAYGDIAAPDGFDAGDVEVPLSATSAFDYALDPAQPPLANPTQTRAAATNAFVLVNWAHDWLRNAGFDERAGNAQTDNFDAGGLGADSVLVEVNDRDTHGNANMRTPPDGFQPRLQLGVYSAARPERVLATLGGADAGRWGGLAAALPAVFTHSGPPAFPISPNTDGGTGCTHYQNAAEVSGHVAVIGPINCLASAMLAHARDAGATGLVVAGRVSNVAPGFYYHAAFNPLPTIGLSPESFAELVIALDAGTLDTLVLDRPASVDRSTAFDATVVLHEYGHLLTGRLISDGSGLSTIASGALGEGWSDFLGLLAVARVDDGAGNWGGAFAIAGYANQGLLPNGDPNDAWFRGSRRFPYSAGLAINGLSFRHIQSGEPLPAGSGGSTSDNTEVHNAGEVWGSMLWSGYVAMLRDSTRHTFDQARDLTLVDLVAALKATPKNPGFLDARDALLAVVAARDQQDLALWLSAFASRGAGLLAVQPDSFASDLRPVIEDTGSVGPAISVLSVEVDDAAGPCDHDGALSAGESATLLVKLLNRGSAPLTGATLAASTTTALVNIASASMNLPTVPPFGTAVVQLPVSVERDFAGNVVSLTLAPRGGGLPSTDFAWTLLANLAETPSDVETWLGDSPAWHLSYLSRPLSAAYKCRTVANGVSDQMMFCANAPSQADEVLITPEIDVGPGPLTLSFKQAWSMEVLNGNSYDGLILEESQAPYTTWVPVPRAALMPDYPGTIAASSGATLKGSAAWVGESASFPELLEQRVELGLRHAGKKVKFRFRLSTDGSGGARGWFFDDFRVEGAVRPPFLCLLSDVGVCGNHPPVVVAGAGFSANEGAEVTLPLVSVTDPDGDAVTGSWSQLSGAPVSLGSATFTAPAADMPTPLGFRYTATDGRLSASDDVIVTITHLNRSPMVAISGPGTAEPGASVTLSAVATDYENEPLTFAWTQTAGPSVAIDPANLALMQFTVPEVKGASTFTFVVTANDGQADGKASISVNVLQPTGCGCQAAAGGSGAWLALSALALRRRRARMRAC